MQNGARKTVRSRAVGVRRSSRLEIHFLPTMLEFSQRLCAKLPRIEREVARSEEGVRREAARVLQHSGYRFETEGERRWRKLTLQAGREALQVLRRIEKDVTPRTPRRRAAKPEASRFARVRTATAIALAAPSAAATVGLGGSADDRAGGAAYRAG